MDLVRAACLLVCLLAAFTTAAPKSKFPEVTSQQQPASAIEEERRTCSCPHGCVVVLSSTATDEHFADRCANCLPDMNRNCHCECVGCKPPAPLPLRPSANSATAVENAAVAATASSALLPHWCRGQAYLGQCDHCKNPLRGFGRGYCPRCAQRSRSQGRFTLPSISEAPSSSSSTSGFDAHPLQPPPAIPTDDPIEDVDKE